MSDSDHAQLPIDTPQEEEHETPQETPEETTNRINRSRIENYLNKISEKILNNNSFLALKELKTF